MNDLRFGVSISPDSDVQAVLRLATEADDAGLDYIGVMDHPYGPSGIDTMALIGHILAATHNVHCFPDVANLPLRPPAVLARTAATLSLLSGGRFQLGLGAGGLWDAIAAMGGPRHSASEAIAALQEAISIIRDLWVPGRVVNRPGHHYSVAGITGAPPALPSIELWVGAQGRRSMALTAQAADGWAAPLPAYLPYEQWAPANEWIDRVALDAGRQPASIRRIAQLTGTITSTHAAAPVHVTSGASPIRTSADGWAHVLTELATDQPFRTFIFWPEQQDAGQVQRFAHEVAPLVRARLGVDAG